MSKELIVYSSPQSRQASYLLDINNKGSEIEEDSILVKSIKSKNKNKVGSTAEAEH